MIQHSAVVRVGLQLLLSAFVACAADAQSTAGFGQGIAAPGAKLTLLAEGIDKLTRMNVRRR
jgi:hypothetical protein